ncbi:TetR/AcrR family transcriptional regulator [Nonomuraea sp. NPDC005650]|uniref:TetR/AcrR family transcriptional regulator n=1 Tax=Nonomuraea sp. NPDC005650 TaxID=3157045 RepID=UPI0033B0AB05
MPSPSASDASRLLWSQTRDQDRRPPLSLDKIARTATDIADAEGLDAVSMQRIAADLGFTKMSLYRHVSNKAELVAIMIDLAVGQPPVLSAISGGWRPRIEHLLRHLTQTWSRHPWLPSTTTGERPMGPNEVAWTDRAVEALSGTGLGGDERLAAAFVLFGHIRNTQSMATAGTQPWASGGHFDPALTELLRGRRDDFPALAEAISGGADALADNGRRFGLDRILDGLAALIAQRT